MGIFLLVQVMFAILWTGLTWSGFGDKWCPRGVSDEWHVDLAFFLNLGKLGGFPVPPV
jgi:hypothetical protein